MVFAVKDENHIKLFRGPITINQSWVKLKKYTEMTGASANPKILRVLIYIGLELFEILGNLFIRDMEN